MLKKRKRTQKDLDQSALLYSKMIKDFIPIKNILTGINKHSINIEKGLAEKKFDNLYDLLSKQSLLVQAYGNIQRNKGSLTSGTDKTTIDGVSLKKLQELALEIKNKTFKFSLLRRIYVPKPKRYKPGEKKKLRPIGIPNFKDRIIQEAIRIILETIYEPVFEKRNDNYGFRPNKSCHQAIIKIRRQGTGLTSALEGDIEGAYDNVDHDILINILKKRIQDEKFLKLLNQGFKSGLLDQGKRQDTLLGVPQGGLASPILFNIYMQEFDNFINTDLQTFIDDLNTKEGRVQKPRNLQYDTLSSKITIVRNTYKRQKGNTKWVETNETKKNGLRVIINNLKILIKRRLRMPSTLASKRLIKILYIRYADDWIILSNAKPKIIIEIKNKIKNWLSTNLKLNLSESKTYITNLKFGAAKFVGFSIRSYTRRKISKSPEYNELIKSAGWNLVIDIDEQRILDRLFIKGFIDKKNKPIGKRPWATLREEEIINRYNYIMRGTANYYFPVLDRLSRFQRIFYILKFSCLGTFAKKFNSKITNITKKFGDPLKVTIKEKQTLKKHKMVFQKSKTITLLSYLALKNNLQYKKYSWKTQDKKIPIISSDIFKPMETINWRTLRNLTNVCTICGSAEDVQIHHVKHIRKGIIIGFHQVLRQLNRTMIPLCSTHHREVHQGKYSDIKLTDLFGLERFLE
uniref:HNH endonuclease n=1 Tax=Chlamydomonas nivalis TaxID=47906 RepID=A0A0S2IB93_9CHLO|nr:HNH endonuclease [Chlamydomonas nivalis]